MLSKPQTPLWNKNDMENNALFFSHRWDIRQTSTGTVSNSEVSDNGISHGGFLQLGIPFFHKSFWDLLLLFYLVVAENNCNPKQGTFQLPAIQKSTFTKVYALISDFYVNTYVLYFIENIHNLQNDLVDVSNNP